MSGWIWQVLNSLFGTLRHGFGSPIICLNPSQKFGEGYALDFSVWCKLVDWKSQWLEGQQVLQAFLHPEDSGTLGRLVHGRNTRVYGQKVC